VGLVVGGLSLRKNNSFKNSSGETVTVKTGDVDSDLCSQFTADFIYSAINKSVAYVEPSEIKGIFSCKYYTSYSQDYYKIGDGKTMPGGPWFSLVLDNLPIENQKKGNEHLGYKVSTDPQIKMENMVVRQEDGNVNAIYLVINPNRFISIRRSSTTVISNEEHLLLAARVAEKIQGKVSFPLKKNPVEIKTEKKEEVGASQKQTASNFMQFLSDKKWDEAVRMMDSDAGDKESWKANFATIKSLKVLKVEPVYQEEWTSSRQVYKFELEVSVSDQGLQMGWENGKNLRWVGLQKNGDVWQVHELANNP